MKGGGGRSLCSCTLFYWIQLLCKNCVFALHECFLFAFSSGRIFSKSICLARFFSAIALPPPNFACLVVRPLQYVLIFFNHLLKEKKRWRPRMEFHPSWKDNWWLYIILRNSSLANEGRQKSVNTNYYISFFVFTWPGLWMRQNTTWKLVSCSVWVQAQLCLPTAS